MKPRRARVFLVVLAVVLSIAAPARAVQYPSGELDPNREGGRAVCNLSTEKPAFAASASYASAAYCNLMDGSGITCALPCNALTVYWSWSSGGTSGLINLSYACTSVANQRMACTATLTAPAVTGHWNPSDRVSADVLDPGGVKYAARIARVDYNSRSSVSLYPCDYWPGGASGSYCPSPQIVTVQSAASDSTISELSNNATLGFALLVFVLGGLFIGTLGRGRA